MMKIINIDGMSCGHCVKSVTTALNKINGVQVLSVSLEKKNAEIEADEKATDQMLINAVTEAGYDVIDIM